jgi:uncharacterized protein YcnI
MKARHLLVAGAAALVGLTLSAAPAAAHVYPTVSEAPAGSYLLFNMVVPHGCEEAGTTSIEVQLPEGIYSATPEAVPGWTVSKTTETLAEPVDDGEGGQITERDATVTWEGGPLAHDQLLEFGLSVKLPDTAGETILFPTIQSCEGGASTDWIEETPEGGEEPEHPAPAITLTEATGDGHGASSDEEEPAMEDDASTVDTETAASTSDDSDDGNGLAIAALVAGLAGLGLGGVAFARTRSSS